MLATHQPLPIGSICSHCGHRSTDADPVIWLAEREWFGTDERHWAVTVHHAVCRDGVRCVHRAGRLEARR